MSPRVVFVSPVPLDSPRGNAITVARIAQGLRARGLDLCVKCTDDPGLAEPAPGKLPALVHAFHAYRAGPRGLALARSRRVPLVITLTGTDVSDDLQDSTRGQVVRETLLGAAAITAFHDSIAAEIVAALPAVASRLTVVPQSVSLLPASAGGDGVGRAWRSVSPLPRRHPSGEAATASPRFARSPPAQASGAATLVRRALPRPGGDRAPGTSAQRSSMGTLPGADPARHHARAPRGGRHRPQLLAV